jgi:hypothetical protein
LKELQQDYQLIVEQCRQQQEALSAATNRQSMRPKKLVTVESQDDSDLLDSMNYTNEDIVRESELVGSEN